MSNRCSGNWTSSSISCCNRWLGKLLTRINFWKNSRNIEKFKKSNNKVKTFKLFICVEKNWSEEEIVVLNQISLANFEIVIAISLRNVATVLSEIFQVCSLKEIRNKTKKFFSHKNLHTPILFLPPLENPVPRSPKNTTNQNEFQGNFDDTFDGELITY